MKYTKEILADTVRQSISYAQVLRKLGLKEVGGNFSHMKKRITKEGIDTSHFVKYTYYLRGGQNKKRWEEILVKHEDGQREGASRLRRALMELGREYFCEECRLGNEWNGKSITLEVDHKNRDWLDNRPDNLRFLCPNCHSQHPNHKGLVMERQTCKF